MLIIQVKCTYIHMYIFERVCHLTAIWVAMTSKTSINTLNFSKCEIDEHKNNVHGIHNEAHKIQRCIAAKMFNRLDRMY